MNRTVAHWLALAVLTATGVALMALVETGFASAGALEICSSLRAQAGGQQPPPNPAVGAEIVSRIPGTSSPTPPNQKQSWHQLAVAPAPFPLDFSADAPLEHAIEVTHIKFDHTAHATTDGLNIRWTKDYDLRHEGNGRGAGEYVPVMQRNEPACFVADRQCKIKVRLEAKLSGLPALALASARMRADYTGDSAYLTTWLNLIERTVAFRNGISLGDDGSEYVEFTCAKPVHGQIYLATGHFKFFAKDLMDRDHNSIDTPNVEAMVDETSRNDVYVVLGDPGQPWYRQGEQSEPWVSALFFSVIYRCVTIFEDTPAGALNCTTVALHSHHGLAYDRRDSRSRYTGFAYRTPPPDPAQPPPPDAAVIDLESYMLRTNPECNCHDQAAAVAVLGNLVAGSTSVAFYFDLFGYLATTILVGGANTNHPVKFAVVALPDGRRFAYDPRDIVGADDIYIDMDGDSDLDRSLFSNHAFVKTDNRVKDACCGPFTTLTIGDYMAAACDRTSYLETGFLRNNPSTGALEVSTPFHAAGTETSFAVFLKLR